MKICFFDFTTMVGGATKGSIYLLQRLEKKGLNVSVIDVYGNCSEYIEDVKNANIHISILNKKDNNVVIGHNNNKIKRFLEVFKQLPSFLKILANLIIQIKKQKPDYVLVNNEKSLFFLSMAKKFSKFKIVLYYRGEAKKSHISSRFINLINNETDVAYCHSMKAISNMKIYGIEKNINYLPNCIPMKTVNVFLKNKKNMGDIKVLLSAGRVVKEKGYHTAIEAIGVLKRKGYNIKLILPGLIVDEDYTKILENLIDEYNLKESVIFIGWVNNLTEVLSTVDYMVLPSYTEGFPRSIIESMLLKIPVCATPVGGIPEAIFHGKTGYLFDIDDSSNLADSIQNMIDNPEKTKVLIQNAYDFAIEIFDEDKNTEVFLRNLE